MPGIVAVVIAIALMLLLVFEWLPAALGRLGGCHPEPDTPYGVQEAHEVMQDLIDCDAAVCAAKKAAMDVLIAAKHFVPARADR
ncbi:hypothetical protein LTT66_18465 [Nocardia gipuzkoensis]|uniref:hypothetical protein n=1 Tax=Nocardia gipuzkoensis TaxID=2749991 RepID=UPI001E653DAD|nr:hypothetical protein [Nocardia gipuzkoensis]UGT65354.1 hypothetical protein LTT66_18465 [Nocardia gipuzkoensis]